MLQWILKTGSMRRRAAAFSQHASRLLLLVTMVMLQATCASHQVSAPEVLKPVRTATLSGLVQLINQTQELKTLAAEADLSFDMTEDIGVIDTSKGPSDEPERRHLLSTKAKLVLTRGGRMRLEVLDDLLGTTVAEMASDGRGYELLIHVDEYEAMVERTDSDSRARLHDRGVDLEMSEPFVYLRPQEFMDAFFFPRIPSRDPDMIITEDKVEMPEGVLQNHGTAPNREVVKPYYILSIANRSHKAAQSEFWFDRSNSLLLARRKRTDIDGLLVCDVSYSGYLSQDPVARLRFPSVIRIDMPVEKLSIQLVLDPTTMTINEDIPSSVFSLQTPEQWTGRVRHLRVER